MVWCKFRNDSVQHALYDNARGVQKELGSDTTAAQTTRTNGLTAFGSSGFTLGSDSVVNQGSAPNNYVSWTFRKQAKFFDVVTYTGDGTSGRTVEHNLGSAPGFLVIKAYSGSGSETYSWICYHRSLGTGSWIELNQATAKQDYAGLWTNTNASTFDAQSLLSLNDSGKSYVAYLFAHDAGGFGTAGTDNVISCGSCSTDGSGNATVTLGYEPQWVLFKKSSGALSWYIWDTMRGMVVGGDDAYLLANTTAQEGFGDNISPTATGFLINGTQNSTWVYVAIRRGPMKTPTDATKVFYPAATTGSTVITTGFPVDLAIFGNRDGGTDHFLTWDRMRGSLAWMRTAYTAAESSTTSTYETVFDNNTQTNYKWHDNTVNIAGWNFRRAPGFFDVVCYTGNSTGSTTKTVSHNLGVAPELIIIKGRSTTKQWEAQHSFGGSSYSMQRLNLTDQAYSENYDNANIHASAPTSTQFQLGGQTDTNGNNVTYVAYLFASLTGISKVGSYTGNGSSQTINCGFTAGARFILIKRTDSTGDWYVYDSARGIVSGNDPYLLLNSTAAGVTNTDYIDTASAGFEISSTAPAAINANGGTFIFLAIA